MIDQIALAEDKLAEFCQRHHIRKLALFGSVLRADFRPDSDVDVLVEFEEGVEVGFFEFARAQNELSDLLGREVDLNTPGFLGRRFRQEVIDTAYLLYEQAR